MKKVWKILLGIIITLFGIIIIAASTLFIHSNNQSILEREISNKIDLYKSGETDQIEIKNIDHFKWDHVYIFPAYTNCDHVIEILNPPPLFAANCDFIVPLSEGYSLFVFTKNGRIVRYTSVAQSTNDINPNGFRKDQALFTINEKHELIWLGQ